MGRTQEYLTQIRELDGLKHAILGGITVAKSAMTAEFSLITDLPYTSAEEAKAREISAQFVPACLKTSVKIIKRVPDKQILKNVIYKYVG